MDSFLSYILMSSFQKLQMGHETKSLQKPSKGHLQHNACCLPFCNLNVIGFYTLYCDCPLYWILNSWKLLWEPKLKNRLKNRIEFFPSALNCSQNNTHASPGFLLMQGSHKVACQSQQQGYDQMFMIYLCLLLLRLIGMDYMLKMSRNGFVTRMDNNQPNVWYVLSVADMKTNWKLRTQ